jgi:hypothetical protein
MREDGGIEVRRDPRAVTVDFINLNGRTWERTW